MIAIRFLGAAGEVTGSMHLVETPRGNLLVDCGFYQGRRAEARERNLRLPAAVIDADAMILTHAHIDHSGSVPTLVRAGYRGAVWCTPATRDLALPMLRDSARIQESDAAWLNRKHARDRDFVPIEPIYDEAAAIKALTRFIGVPYETRFSPLPGVTARFIEAGHILGSAQVVLDVELDGGERRRVVFTGDLGRRQMPLLRDAVVPEGVDHLVMESTYGGREHGSLGKVHDELAETINTTVARGGRVIVPAFALGRTQELVYALHSLHRAGRIPALPVYVDSPLATRVTEVYKLHLEVLDEEARAFIEQNGDPFNFTALRYVESTEESMRLNQVREPIIIIAASGMCESGRVLHHLRNAVGDERNTILVVGFMAQHTLGRRLVERRSKIRIFGVEHELFAKVVVQNALSAHADAQELRAYALAAQPARGVILVHGEPDQQGPLRAALEHQGLRVAVPARGDRIELD